jgi:hypothetical protein
MASHGLHVFIREPESRRRGSNPLPTAWKAVALPNELLLLVLRTLVWRVVDSNHRSRKTADLQSAPFGHSGNSPQKIIRAEERNRTDDLLITNQLLYHLSYFGLLFQTVILAFSFTIF